MAHPTVGKRDQHMYDVLLMMSKVTHVIHQLAVRTTVALATLAVKLESWTARRQSVYTSGIYLKRYFTTLSTLVIAVLTCTAQAGLCYAITSGSLLGGAHAADPDNSSSRPPSFDGSRTNFISWIMNMTAFVAWLWPRGGVQPPTLWIETA
jgi:hypothetical protein